MSTLRYLERWKTAGVIPLRQHDVLAALVRKDRVSVFVELNALLYAGVVTFIAGVGWTIQTYFASLGDAAVLSSLSLLLAGCLVYCFTRSAPYCEQRAGVVAFRVRLCALPGLPEPRRGARVSGIPFSHPEAELGSVSAAVGGRVLLPCPIDSTIVSSSRSVFRRWQGGSGCGPACTALCSARLWTPASLRPYALAYGGVVAAPACSCTEPGSSATFSKPTCTSRQTCCSWPFSPVFAGSEHEWLYLMVLCVLAGLAIAQGIRTQEICALSSTGFSTHTSASASRCCGASIGDTDVFAYFTVSGVLVIAGLVMLARRFGREE